MCGIVGYIGARSVVTVLMEGLKRLEYRGYDSAGLAIASGDSLREVKSLGKLSFLEQKLEGISHEGDAGIGHTRWATHGRPSEPNAHPHFDCSGDIALVHNGIIENFQSIKDRLTGRGHRFKSETDTEVVVHLLEEHWKGDLEAALRQTIKELKGSFALGVISRREPGKIVAARRDSPLIIGLGEGENFLASDIPAFLDFTRRALLLSDDEIAVITKEGVRITDCNGNPVERKAFDVLWDSRMAEKSGYRHFMLKEIYEQPRVVRDTLRGRIDEKWRVTLRELNLKARDVAKVKRIFIIACGTALHAGMVGKYLIEEVLRIPVEIDMASEFRYRRPMLDGNSLLVAISQSGETADTLAAVREGKRQGAQVVAVTNVVGSSITREVDGVLYTRAGPEIGVAATKTFIAQLVALYLLTFYLAQKKKSLPEETRVRYLQELVSTPDMLEEILSGALRLRNVARKFHQVRDVLFLGRNINYPIALEGALKLKEISYIHAEGYAAGEMKHGPIALIDNRVPVVALATQGELLEKMVSNIKEVKAREAVTIGVATRGDEDALNYLDYPFFVPPTSEILSPLVSIVPLQLLSYFIADRKGCDIDQPRNLAKSVTVE